ncbi:MAG: methylmalonyl-CoA mutase family protein [Bacteroidota bacterium]
MAETTNRLFPEFPEVTTQQWEDRITADLKGKDYEKALVWRTNEGISVKPYYRAENLEGLEFLGNAPGAFPFVRGNYTENNWLIRQDIRVTDAVAANRKALEVLGKGVNSLGFIFDCNSQAGPADLEVLLRDICLEAAEINLTCSCKSSGFADAFIQLVNNGPWQKENVRASLNDDPLGFLLLKGKFPGENEAAGFDSLKRNIEISAGLRRFRTIGVNGKVFGNSGSSVVQELAFSLAQGAEYLIRLTEAGLTVDQVASKIKFNLSIGNNYFMEIAKLRAGRLLWSRIVKAFGPEKDCSARMIVHSENARYNKTVYDAYTNLLRTQTEAMSAALGGAHSVTVLPFDAMYQDSTAFSERIARNQQILLKEESNIDKIADPAGGAYYIETLTASVAEQAWKLFLEVQDQGGFLAAVRNGFIQKQVREMAGRRDLNIAQRRENLLGVNQFPNFGEIIRSELADSVFTPCDQTVEGAEVETLKPYRGAAAFEALRYKTDRYAAQHGRPLAFMLTIGNLAMRKARAQFACNFFAVAGFEVMDNNGFASVDEGLAAARAANAKIVVVCSSDEEYAEIVPEIAGKLKDEVLVVAGNPACKTDLEAIGVTNFVHVRSNLLIELGRYQEFVL